MSTLLPLPQTAVLRLRTIAVGRGLLQRWAAYLLAPVGGASVAAFRVLFGGLLFWEVLRYFQYGWIERYYITPTFHFTYPFLDFIRPWPGNGMYLHFVVMGALALLVALGLFYRLAAPLFCLAFTNVFLLDKAFYLNHFYLIALLSFLLCLIPAHHTASLDHWLFFRSQAPVVPRWSVLLLRAQIFIVYFYAGLAKLNPDWLHGEPMRMWLAERTDLALIGRYFTSEWMVFFFAYGGLLFDLSIGFLLLWRRTRPWALGLAGLFHLFNSQLFHIGIFPTLAFGASFIFAEPDWPRYLVRPTRQMRAGASYTSGSLAPPAPGNQLARMAMLVVIHVYLLTQCLLPLRHWLYPGNVNWTEEGHRFAWHMKLRSKAALLHIYLADPRTSQTWEISPAMDLSARQLNEMSTRPDMVVQYAHHLAEQFSRRGQPRPIIQVDLQVSLNGRPYQSLIDPTVNLADVPLISLKPAGWILPLAVPLPAQTNPISNALHGPDDFDTFRQTDRSFK
jgi:hypothetical protein